MSRESNCIAALWGFDESGRYPPQFVAGVAESLRDSWFEESERLRGLAEEWFASFGEPDDGPWRFEVFHHQLEAPTRGAE
jgi:hypothetical protein